MPFWGQHLRYGTEDSLRHAELHLLDTFEDAHILLDANIIKARLLTKRFHPLAGPTMQGLPGMQSTLHRPRVADSKVVGLDGNRSQTCASEPHFVVRQNDFAVSRPKEIVGGGGATEDDRNPGRRAVSF